MLQHQGKMMQQQQQVDDAMSNLTSASNEASLSSSSNRNNNNLEIASVFAHHRQQSSFASPSDPSAQPPPKKKRNLPGNPDPEAEVVALSPRSLLATNRFVCEICNKGFQRDQNLQLHRRGHNLPWKLKQRSNKEVVKKKVYVCPEPTCVHHDPSRALGDLTGIKKHFSRKHGEKKWKCEKCSKRYAVQSDWKAHSKICGTREYRCDCGTLFSRRDSFITHRAFCDALTEESSRTMSRTTAPNPLLFPSSSSSSTSNNPHHHLLQFHPFNNFPLKQEQQHFTTNNNNNNTPPWLAPPQSQLFIHPQNPSNNSPLQDGGGGGGVSPSAGTPHMSATALLQKAATMGVTMSKNETMFRLPHQMVHMTAAASSTTNSNNNNNNNTAVGLGLMTTATTSRDHHHHHHLHHQADQMVGINPTAPTAGTATGGGAAGFLHHIIDNNNNVVVVNNNNNANCMEQQQTMAAELLLHHQAEINNIMMNTTNASSASSSFDQTFNAIFNSSKLRGKEGGSGLGGNDGLTRDFLGLRAFPSSQRDFLNMAAAAGLDHHQMASSSTTYDHQQHTSSQNQRPWQT